MSNILALDVGEKRIGVARANDIAKIAEPLETLQNDNNFVTKLTNIINQYEIDLVVVGLPRNLAGQETAQSLIVRQFTQNYLSNINFTFQDETLSTVEAGARYNQKDNQKYGIDSLAACVILEDYLK